MSIQDLELGLKLVDDNKEIADFLGTRHESVLNKAESALGLTFCPTYRRFLSNLGCGDIGGVEFYGIIDDEFINSSIPNAIWLTLQERKDSNLPESLIIIGSTGDGGYYAIDCSKISKTNENPIIEWWFDKKHNKQIAEDFGEFFLKMITEALDKY